MRRRSFALVSGLGAVLIAASGCSTATPTGTPGVSRLGETVLQYKGPQIEAVLSYRFANTDLGAPWLMLDLLVTGSNRIALELKREYVSIKLPDGTVVPLPRQEELGKGYNEIRAADMRADVAREPLAYYADRREEALNFLVPPGSGLAYDSVWVNDLQMAIGRLYFPMPKGVQSGRYELRFDLPESKVRIPFQLGTARK